MILQQLWKDADAIMTQTGRGSLPPAMYSPKPIKWIVELSHDLSKPVQFTPTVTDKKKGIERLTPSMKRTATVIRPHLFADKPSYTFGIRIADPKLDANRNVTNDTAHAAKQHQAYKNMVQACAEATGNKDVAVVAKFLDGWSKQNPPVVIPVEMTRDDWLTFRVDDDVLPMELAEVQEFWAKAAAGECTEETEEELELGLPEKSAMQCLVSGANGPVEEMMPVPVKGLYGGKSEMAIVSANANAFESYGLIRARTSPISKDAGERFGQALNALLASRSHHVRGGSITYVFWARGAVVPLLAFQPQYNDSKTLKEFITSAWKGDTQWANGLPPKEKFHIYGLTANVARVVVRSALDMDIEELGKRQAQWFSQLQICDPNAEEGQPLALWQLFVAPYRVAQDVPASVEDALVQAAFAGRRLPLSLLQTLVMRCRAGTLVNKKRVLVSYERAALLKYLLIQEGLPIMPELDPDNQSPAYRCGRLLAELEYIQYVASDRKINSTLVDRYFATASTSPRTVFPSLVRLANQAHLPKIRRSKPGFFQHLQNQLADIQQSLGTSYPPTLQLIQQGEFALGYYFQRASLHKKRDANTSSEASTLEMTDDEGETA